MRENESRARSREKKKQREQYENATRAVITVEKEQRSAPSRFGHNLAQSSTLLSPDSGPTSGPFAPKRTILKPPS
jgi:hypothetical protein